MVGKIGKPRDWEAISLIGFLALILVSFSAFLFWIIANGDEYAGVNMKTFCKKELESVTIVLIDKTDNFEGTQQQRLSNELNILKDTIPRFGKFVIYAVDLDEENGFATSLADVCNPGDPQKVPSFFNSLPFVTKSYNDFYSKPLNLGFNKLTEDFDEQPASPIIEAIGTVTNKSFGSLPNSDSVTKKIILVSDMIQNSGPVSFYVSIPPFESFKSTAPYTLHSPYLSGVEVTVWEVARERVGSDSEALVRFWRNYFLDSDASLADSWWKRNL